MAGNYTILTPFIDRIIRSWAMAIVTLCIILGNTFCLIVLRRGRNLGMKETTKVFMISLTCADLTLGIAGAIPVTISAALGYFPSSPSLPLPFCLYHAVISCNLAFTSCCSLFGVTTERYISLVYPLRYMLIVTVRRSKIIVSSLWIIQGLISITLVAIVQPRLEVGPVLNQDYLMCFPTPNRDTYTFSFLILVFISIPFMTILFMYTKMLMIARRHSANSSREIPVQRSSSVASAIATGNATSERKAAVTFLLITAASVVAWLPFTVVTFKEYFLQHFVESNWKFICVLFLFCGSWFNVVIYYVRNERFRAAAKHMISANFN